MWLGGLKPNNPLLGGILDIFSNNPVFKSLDCLNYKVTSHLFDIMSGQSGVDHPLCEECTDTLLDQLDQQLRITEDELKDYKVFFNKLNDKPSLDTEALSKELTDLRKEEEELIRKLEEVEKERGKVAEKMEMEKERSKQLEAEEKKYWTEYSEYQKELLEYEDEQQRLVAFFPLSVQRKLSSNVRILMSPSYQQEPLLVTR